MAGRPITDNSPRAQRKRERMRRVREAMKARPLPINPEPLEQAISRWKTS